MTDNSKLIESLKRANKERKQKMAEKAGFKNATEFLNYLQKKKPTAKKKQTYPIADMVIAFDTTGSMASYIASVRQHVAELIPALFKSNPNLRLKIVAFGDYCDMQSGTHFGKAYQETPLTDDQNSLMSFVQNASNTGDGDEFYELVIKKIVEETKWRKGKRSVLLIADAEPHKVGYKFVDKFRQINILNTIDWKQEAKKAADLGIQFDTLRISPAVGWYAELSQITGGVSLDFKSSGKMSDVVMASTYARSSKEMFVTTMADTMSSGDEELIGVYKSLSKLVD
jgi:hypothetical protein